MKRHLKSSTLALGVAGLLSLALFIFPWSPSTQPGGFSLALDLDDADGNQAVSSLDLLPHQPVSLQIFARDIQNATGISMRFGYDTTQLIHEGFDPGEVLPNVHAIVQQDSTSIRIGVSSLSGSATGNAGWVGTVRFRTTGSFSDTEIWLVSAELSLDGQSEVISPALGVALQVAAPASPDFDGNGLVGFSDFVAFAGAFGAQRGDGKYVEAYDLNNDGTIAFNDFVIFATSFGEAANRAPAFTAASPVTRSVEENTSAGQPIGDPLTATDADDDSLTYHLRGVYADRFSIGASTGQLVTKEGIAYDHEARDAYSVTVRVTDGQGGRATIVLGIAVTDVDEPPGGPPAGVVVAPRDTALTVTWSAAPDEAGKPPVSGYEVAHRPADSEEWLEGRFLGSRADTSVTLTGLANEQPYQVRVRTLNDEGTSDWSEPVVGAPTVGPRALGIIGDQSLILGRDLRVNIASLFTRPALGTLTYGAASSNEAIAAVTVSDSMATVHAVALGRATITATASDVYGNTAQTTFPVVVTTPPPPPPPPGPVGPIGPFRPPPPPPPPPPPANNRTPSFDDGANTSRTVPENTPARQPIQHPVRATDPDGHRLTYNLTGPDSASFAVDVGSGQLRTLSGITYDFEDNDRYSVELEADDPYGGNATIGVAIHVADVDEPPDVPDRPQVQPASSTSLTVTWTAPTNTGPFIFDYDVQYRTGSGNFDPWPHDNTGTTTTITNLEVNKRYEVQVRAHNDEGESLWSPSGFGTTSANLPPVFDEGGSTTRSLGENTPSDRNIGGPVTATDPEGSEVSYRFDSGDTEGFAIDPNTGQLKTRTGVTYDFETKDRYTVRVEAQDEQGGRSTISVSIEVTDDDNERPETPDKPTVTASTLNSLSIRWTAPANAGPNINDYDVQYSEDGGAFTGWPHTGPGTTTTITGLKANTPYQVQVLARSDEGESLWSESVDVRTVANRAPTFNEGTRTTRSLDENTTGTHDVGNPITARDTDGGTLSYDLEGTDQASFDLDGNQLQTQSGETYDFEEKPGYDVTVRVEDGQGGSNTIEVTINLTDQQEKPGIPDAPGVSAASSTSLTATWDGPANTGPDVNDYDVQYREGDSGGFSSWTHNGADRTATITDRTPGTTHQVQVLARSPEGTSDWSESGTGSTSPNQLPIFTDGSGATRELAENTTGVKDVGDPVGATDSEKTTLTYALEGTHADTFSIDARSGQIRTRTGKTYDYEATPRFSVDVRATDGHGGDNSLPVSIDLTDLNEVPVFPGEATLEAAENQSFAGTVTAEDLDRDDAITNYTITGGSDRDLLEISSGGALTFKDDPDFESPTDAGRNNGYVVEVTVTGGSGGRALTAEQHFTVTVTDENEPPRFTSVDTFAVKENELLAGRLAAQDVDRDDGITGYEVNAGRDGDRFEIENTRELHFKDKPDFERPADSGGNNEYIVVVEVTGGADTRERNATQTITVTVEDDVEPPGEPDPPTVSDETESSLTVSWDEPDNPGPAITNYFVQYRESGAFIDSPDSGLTRTRTITGLRSGRTYQIQVQAKNDEGKGPWSGRANGTTLTAPTVSSAAFTSTPASGQNGAYKKDDVIDVTATFNEAVTVTGAPQIDLTIGSTLRKADYKSGSTTTQLLFQYAVADTDEDKDGATINENGLKLNNGRIYILVNSTTVNADLAHAARANRSSHKVDGVPPGLTDTEVKSDELVLTFGESLDRDPRPATGDFSVTADDSTLGVTAVTMRTSDVALTIDPAVTPGQTVSLAYTPGTNPIRDQAQNPAIALTNLTVRNNTQDQTLNVCVRTRQVRDAITDAAGVSTCGEVTGDHLSAITRLSLSEKNISTLKANDFAGLTALETLFLRDNQISSLPQDLFSALSALETLSLRDNDFASLNASLFSSLSDLRILLLDGNQLDSLHTDLFSELSALEALDLNGNGLSSLPQSVFSNLSALRILDLDGNKLSSLDASVFSSLSALEGLDLDGNELSSLDASVFSNLSALRILDLNGNKLSSLNTNIFSSLSALESLDLDGNGLSSLDASTFSNLSALQALDLSKNQLSSLPQNIFSGLSSLQALYLNEQESGHELGSLDADIFSGLTALTTLRLEQNDIGSLDAGLFTGLTDMETLRLDNNSLSSLPDGIFSGLTSLTTLNLEGNTVDPLPINVSLERVALGQFRAKANTGAPFDMVLALLVTNGSIDGGGSSIEIPQGDAQSSTYTVTRTTGMSAAVTVDIGTFPDLPGTDNGYALVKSDDLPLEVIPGLPDVNIYPTALSVAVGDSNTYTMALNSMPTMDVTVTVDVPSGSDVSVNPMERMFAADTYDMSQTVTVIADTAAVADAMVTLSHMVSGGDYQNVSADDVAVTIIGATTGNQLPTFVSDSRYDVKENETSVATVAATDGDARDYVTGYEITGGAQQAQFEITGDGVLTFVTAPDFERPAVSSNSYVVTVTATSGIEDRERTARQTIVVSVTDDDEPPGQPPAPILDLSYASYRTIGVSPGRRPPANTGPEITAWDIQYRIRNTGDFKIHDPDPEPDWTQPDWETAITRLDRGATYEVQVRAKNDEGESEWSPSAEAPIPNQSPVADGSFDDLTLPVGGAVEIVSADDVFDDPDDIRLTYTAASSNTAAASVKVIDTEGLVDPLSSGGATITVTATDPWGASVSESFSVIVRTPTLSAPTLSISGNLFTLEFTNDFAANETRAYEVRIRQKEPIGNWARGCFTITNDENTARSVTVTVQDLVSDFFVPGNTYEADYGYLGTACGGSLADVRSAAAEASVPGTPAFNIDLIYAGGTPARRVQLALDNAVARWERIIAQDIPNHRLSANRRNLLERLFPGTTSPEVVDDLVVYVEVVEIDGQSGTLGQAGRLVWRVPSSLPIAAFIELDRDDLRTMSDNKLTPLVLHEIGHTLGFGLAPWTDHNLLKNPSLDQNDDPIVPAPDTHFSGANAIAAFNAAGGSGYTGAKVPVENTWGGSGSQDSHWRESVMQSELMTPRVGEAVTHPLSAITIQSLADIGYTVDATQADAYTLPTTSKIAMGSEELILLNCVITHPEAGPDRPEPIVLNLRRILESE